MLLAEGDVPIVGGTVISEYIDETRGVLKRERRLFADTSVERAEIRRLVDWYLGKTENEVTRHLVRERKMDEAYRSWLQELRGRAYVELREAPQ